MSDGPPIAARLAAVRARITAAARRAQRDPGRVRLVGVSKRQPAERVAEAARAGLDEIAESYVQEATRKIPDVEKRLAGSDCAVRRWHMVGRLQRNKAAAAVRWFDVIHSVDRVELASALARHAEAADRVLDVLLQVNLSGEPQKGGAPPEALTSLLAACRAGGALRATGLMTVPAANPDPEASRPVFARLRALRDALRTHAGGEHLEDLSMGMSNDFEVAVEEGATLVRVGTALFGARPA